MEPAPQIRSGEGMTPPTLTLHTKFSTQRNLLWPTWDMSCMQRPHWLDWDVNHMQHSQHMVSGGCCMHNRFQIGWSWCFMRHRPDREDVRSSMQETHRVCQIHCLLWSAQDSTARNSSPVSRDPWTSWNRHHRQLASQIGQSHRRWIWHIRLGRSQTVTAWG